MNLDKKLARLLIQHRKTISTAESCSGGLLAHRLTNIPGSSAYFKLGLVTYHNDAKSQLLKIPAKIIKKYGAVSRPVSVLMAKNIKKILKADFGVGITGIAGPTGGTPHKPVGLTFVAVSTPTKTICLKCLFRGTRLQIKNQAATKAIQLLLKYFKSYE